VICEGKVTEPEYFKGFANACENPRVTVECEPEAGVPLSVVRMARDRKREAEQVAEKEEDDNLRYDAVWVVFDVDEHPNIPSAIQMARDNDIHLAVSNPSFELWLLLHFRDHPGPKDRAVVRQLLKGFLPNYDKHVDYKKCLPGYPEAAKRAARLGGCDIQACQPGPNPSSGVHVLTESIRT
jgi:hypothetical protein